MVLKTDEKLEIIKKRFVDIKQIIVMTVLSGEPSTLLRIVFFFEDTLGVVMECFTVFIYLLNKTKYLTILCYKIF